MWSREACSVVYGVCEVVIQYVWRNPNDNVTLIRGLVRVFNTRLPFPSSSA